MTEAETELARAELQSKQARAQLTDTLVDIQARINPRALARDAIEELREVGGELARAGLAAVQRNPMPAIAVGAGLVALFARGWIADAFVTKSAATTDHQPSLSTNASAETKGSSDD